MMTLGYTQGHKILFDEKSGTMVIDRTNIKTFNLKNKEEAMERAEMYSGFIPYVPEPLHLYKITFRHTKAHRNYGKYMVTDWVLFEGKDEEEAKANVRAWVKENRFADGCRNYVKIIRCVEINPEA